ncbi:MAG TPA: nucleoside hydrolase [Bryobacteraceae bacterium]|nr:nucleoside hydrolase [Bryobacteraceae bacterium]
MTRILTILALAVATAAAGEPVRILFDTDMGNDVDDAIALATLHAFETRGEARILAVTITKDNRWAAPYVDLLNTFYGRPGIPLGMVRNGVTPEDGNYLAVVAGKRRRGGALLYPRKVTPEIAVPDAQTVLRQALAEQPDASVVIVQVGFSTNLARLLDSPADAGLVKRKVRLLVMMAGRFSDGELEYNIEKDIPAAQKLFARWPTPIVVSPFELGAQTTYPAVRVDRDFRYVPDHPLADAYRAYQKMPYDEPLWDPTAALYAVRPDAGYFTLGPEGRVSVNEKGVTTFSAGGGQHRILSANAEQRARIVEAVAALASQPPERCR